MKILIISAKFYEDIASELEKGAKLELENAGISYDIITVPGAFEIPAVISMATKNDKYDGYVALGCVIRGETTHYDYVCAESARALMDLSTKDQIPLGYGILTCENKEQAWQRANINEDNKGAVVTKACLSMIKIKDDLNK